MHSAVQTAVVTIISYTPLSGLNFTRYTEQYGSCMPSSPLGVYKPLVTYKAHTHYTLLEASTSAPLLTNNSTTSG